MTITARIRAAIAALRGQVDTDDDAPVVEFGSMREGPLTFARCAENPADTVGVRSASLRIGNIVAIAVTQNDEQNIVVLSPKDARAFAAGVLNSADEADGTSPLVFLPEGARRA